MLAIKPCEVSLLHSKTPRISVFGAAISPFQRAETLRHFSSNKHDDKKKKKKKKSRELVVAGCGGEEKENRERKTFLSLEEAGLVEISGLSTHERFLCRLTISSLNLLRVISEQEGLPIEELNAGRVCDWFLKDKLKREQKLESAVLQWGDDESQFQI